MDWLEVKKVKAKPVACSAAAGMIASICCGGSLVFASIGLGAFYASLRLFQYIPHALGAGAVSIAAINYFFYYFFNRRSGNLAGFSALMEARRTTCKSAAIGLAVMVTAFVLLEWLEHAVVNHQRFIVHPEYALALIPGVPNIHLVYALATFLALPVLWVLPFKNQIS